MPPKVWVGCWVMADTMRGMYCWNSVEKNFNEFMNIHEASWTMSCCVQQWKQDPSCVSKCDSHSSTVYYDWAPDCYWEVNLLLEKIVYWNWSLWGACSFGIRKKLGLCDVKHLTKPEAPPWQNTQLPFGALGCDSGDIAGSKCCSTWLWIWRCLLETASWYSWQNELLPMPRPPPKSTPVQIPDWVHVLSTWEGWFISWVPLCPLLEVIVPRSWFLTEPSWSLTRFRLEVDLKISPRTVDNCKHHDGHRQME